MDGNIEKLLKEISENNISILDEKSITKFELIGKGQFMVYSGKMGDIDIAIKEIPFEKAYNDIKSLIQEVKMSLQTTHKRIPKFYGIFIIEGYVCMVFDLIKGAKTLSEKCKTADYKQQISYLIELISIIKDLHSLKIIHRDLKPVNVMVNSEDQVLLIDFGTSKFSSGTTTNTLDPKGTTFYMAPENFDYTEDMGEENDEEQEEERVHDEKPYKISIQVDIWSLGCLISEICSGIAPWSNVKTKKKIDHFLIMNMLNDKKDFPIPENLKDELKEILKGCFAILPKERFTVSELLQKMIAYRETLEQ